MIEAELLEVLERVLDAVPVTDALKDIEGDLEPVTVCEADTLPLLDLVGVTDDEEVPDAVRHEGDGVA